ncbi:GTP cyclohydrolase II [Alkalicoccus luteus]|uniref:GTP cyclohydrolase II n=1 Tax=Alkalicoccus luteus TaxID=1237094 RepID=UPI004034615D
MLSSIRKDVYRLLDRKIQLIERDGEAMYLVGPVRMPVHLDGRTVTFQWYSWLTCSEAAVNYEKLLEQLAQADLANLQQSSVLVYGDFAEAEDAVTRMHSICHTGDIFGSKRCDCGFQLKQSMRTIADRGAGALFYLANHEGRGIGLFSKAMAYLLQENGFDTIDANHALGFADDARSYEEAVLVLKSLRSKPVTLLTNNPNKIEALTRAGITLTERQSIWGGVSEFNEAYLQTKRTRSGHLEQL